MHVALEEPELVDEMPADYPLRRPRTYAYCLAIGLGITVPCCFATCRHSLLSDELRGEMLPDLDLWERETCVLAVASRGRHSTMELVKITGHCESVIEAIQRGGILKLLAGLGINEFLRNGKFKRPRLHGCGLDTGRDGFHDLVEARFKRGLPLLNTPPVRRLTRAEVARLYGKANLHPRYGEPRASQEGAVGGAAAAPAGQEAEPPKETAPPVARESNRQNEDC
jgi:hypothetical protein